MNKIKTRHTVSLEDSHGEVQYRDLEIGAFFRRIGGVGIFIKVAKQATMANAVTFGAVNLSSGRFQEFSPHTMIRQILPGKTIIIRMDREPEEEMGDEGDGED